MTEKLLGFPLEADPISLPKVGVRPPSTRDDAIIDETKRDRKMIAVESSSYRPVEKKSHRRGNNSQVRGRIPLRKSGDVGIIEDDEIG